LGHCTFFSKEAHANVILCMALKNNLLFSGSLDSTIKIWNPEVFFFLSFYFLFSITPISIFLKN